jgi:hypothetical protein
VSTVTPNSAMVRLRKYRDAMAICRMNGIALYNPGGHLR